MVSLVSRQGRQLQRYDKFGRRLVVGCIPYKLKKVDGHYKLEVLVISSQKREDIMFPKGGWELDESKIQAASREALEEAGVRGKIEASLGNWSYKSKSRDIIHEASMYPLNVTEELYQWPEKASRTRKWVNISQVMLECKQQWMKQALEILVKRLGFQFKDLLRRSLASLTVQQTSGYLYTSTTHGTAIEMARLRTLLPIAPCLEAYRTRLKYLGIEVQQFELGLPENCIISPCGLLRRRMCKNDDVRAISFHYQKLHKKNEEIFSCSKENKSVRGNSNLYSDFYRSILYVHSV